MLRLLSEQYLLYLQYDTILTIQYKILLYLQNGTILSLLTIGYNTLYLHYGTIFTLLTIRHGSYSTNNKIQY